MKVETEKRVAKSSRSKIPIFEFAFLNLCETISNEIEAQVFKAWLDQIWTKAKASGALEQVTLAGKKQGYNALTVCAGNGNAIVLEWYFEKKRSEQAGNTKLRWLGPNEKNKDGYPPLFIACS